MKQIGISLVILGLVLTFCSAFTFFTNRQVCNIGPMDITNIHHGYLTFWPVIGLSIMVLGGVMLWRDSKKQTSTY